MSRKNVFKMISVCRLCSGLIFIKFGYISWPFKFVWWFQIWGYIKTPKILKNINLIYYIKYRSKQNVLYSKSVKTSFRELLVEKNRLCSCFLSQNQSLLFQLLFNVYIFHFSRNRNNTFLITFKITDIKLFLLEYIKKKVSDYYSPVLLK